MRVAGCACSTVCCVSSCCKLQCCKLQAATITRTGLPPHVCTQVQLVVGRHLLIRACRPILAGQPLTSCVLGAERWQHVAFRRAVLRARHGVPCCACERCRLEQRLFPTARFPEDATWLGREEFGGARRGWMQSVTQWLLDRAFGQGRYVQLMWWKLPHMHVLPICINSNESLVRAEFLSEHVCCFG
jgi:hypothetical protein